MHLSRSWPNGRVQEDMHRFLHELANQGEAPSFLPAVDVHETDKGYTLAFDLPGVNPQDVKIEVENGTLTVQGSRKFPEAEGANARRLERVSGTFQRAFKLRAKVDQDAIQARYQDGVLTIELPKAPEAKKREISIDRG